ncbi:hypothetical protein [Pseudoramibacter porci]|uniref:Colicin D immunity protein domain-containing protein n=1 Tax=Pseudoramibacter porci TaxID=2606631 RepID=A0A7X2T9V8_9FIRM|nr:hypothetical protein [Pseudoramibacter porci]MSS18836.1 hypothetical protein [Pseudoramibacter porci]
MNEFTDIVYDNLIAGKAWERCEKYIEDYNDLSLLFDELYESFITAANTIDSDIAPMAVEMIDEIFDQIDTEEVLTSAIDKYRILHPKQQ